MLPRRGLLLVALAAIFLVRSSSSQDASSGDSVAPETDHYELNFIFLSSNNPRLRTSGSIPAVDIALEMVAASGILGKYTLTYSAALDSQCDRTKALSEFHTAVEADEDFVQNIAIIGAGCSVATLPVAEICHYYNIPILSWASVAAELSNRHKYGSSYRLAPSETVHSPGLAALLLHYQWRQLAILTQSESLFLESQSVVIDLLPEVNIVKREFATVSYPLDVPDLFVEELDMRVFVINMYVDHARTILCEAFQRGMYYPRYLWITPGWYGDLWWETIPNDGFECTIEDMETVLSYSLAAVQYPIFSETEQSDLGVSTFQFRQLYGQRLYVEYLMGNIYHVDLTAPLAFDAVWTLAMALKKTQERIERDDDRGCEDLEGELVPLELFDYRNQKLGCLLQESLDQLHFKGISGNVTFDENGDRVGNTVRISQYQRGAGRQRQDGTYTMGTPLIGYAVFEEEGVTITGLAVKLTENNMTNLWPDGVTPDGIPKQLTVSTALPLTVIYYMLSIAGIIFAVVCLIFNIIFRNRKIIKLTSPNLNYLLILGAILLYASVLAWVTPTEEEMSATILCNFRIWLFSIGNTLCLAVVLSKMWRVHYIFAAPSPKRKPKPPQDLHLLIIVSVLVSIDLVILLIPTAVDSARVKGELTESKEHGNTKDRLGVDQIHSYYTCYTESQLIWLFTSYIYKFLLQIASIYFAFMSRKIRVKALNDSKQIAAIIYVTSLLLVISAFGFWIGLVYLNASTAVFGLAQLLTATVILGLLFIPKMISLKLDPHGENIFSSGQANNTAMSMGQSTIDTLESNKQVQEMKEKVKELEAELEKYQENGTNVTSLYTCDTITPTQKTPDIQLGEKLSDTEPQI